jgi:hypothetical protein
MTRRTIIEWPLFSIILISLILLTTATVIADPVLAVKKSSSSVKTVHRTPIKTTATTTTTTSAAHHVKGVKLFRVHTVPSKVVVGSTFGLRGIVFNNSTATITFANGTCTSPLSITFNKNVMTEPQTTSSSCKKQQVTLKPGEQSFILSPNLSGITYRATAPGITNATMTFKYEATLATSKSPISDSIIRVHPFNILPAGPRSTPNTTSGTTSSTPGPTKLPVP